ncbi:MAG: Bax inhibitor-1/YccA family protein [Alphaproteobacteria bacterium]|nr:Bax inhibitor-1/YccA family protein [Alphaproteobacteria bacterium]
MARNFENDRFYKGVVQRTRSYDGEAIDQGLRNYMLSIYNYMALGLGLTGVVAMLTASSPMMLNAIFGTPLQWIVMLAPLGFVFFLSARINHMSPSTAQMVYWTYAALMGLSLSSIFLVYVETSIARVFFITAGTFAGMSLYGYTTRRDLSEFGSFLFMGLIGLVLASIVNIFLKSTGLEFALSAIGVLIFTGLTAYDTQMIRERYFEGDDAGVMTKKAILGALNLYLDFINLFMMLLRLFGDRR